MRRHLVVRFDVTDMTEDEIGWLGLEVQVQGESES